MKNKKLPNPETSKSLPIAMLRAREAIMLSFRPLLAKHGFTEQQWRVLRVLGEKGTSDAGQVAFEACILAPSLSRIIGKLENDNIFLDLLTLMMEGELILH